MELFIFSTLVFFFIFSLYADTGPLMASTAPVKSLKCEIDMKWDELNKRCLKKV